MKAPFFSFSYLLSSLSRAAVLFCVAVSLVGCSVYMAANQPRKRDLSVLQPGTPRAQVIAEFGQPKSTRLVDLQITDVFEFTQGYSKEARVSRAFAHTTIDLATLGLWELAGTPTEAVFSGKKLSFEVTYNGSNVVDRVTKLKVED